MPVTDGRRLRHELFSIRQLVSQAPMGWLKGAPSIDPMFVTRLVSQWADHTMSVLDRVSYRWAD